MAEDLSKVQVTQIIASFEDNLANMNEKEGKWQEEKVEMRDRIRAAEDQIDALQAALESAQTEVAVLKAQSRLLPAHQQELTQLKLQLQLAQTKEQAASQRIKQAVAELESHQDDYDKRISQLLGERKRLNEALGQKEALLEVRWSECQEGKSVIADLQNRVTTLEQLCCGKEDLHLTVERLMSECEALQATKDTLTTELQRLAEHLIALSSANSALTAQVTTANELCHAKDSEIEALKQQVAKLKKRGPPYVPVKVLRM